MNACPSRRRTGSRCRGAVALAWRTLTAATSPCPRPARSRRRRLADPGRRRRRTGGRQAGRRRQLGWPAAWRRQERGGGGVVAARAGRGGVRDGGARPGVRRIGHSCVKIKKRNWWGPQLAAQIEGHQIGGVGEKFRRPTKMAAHLLPLLEIDFWCPPSKS